MVKFKEGDTVRIKATGFVVSNRSRILVIPGDIKTIKHIIERENIVDLTFTDGTGGYHDSMAKLNTQLELVSSKEIEIVLW